MIQRFAKAAAAPIISGRVIKGRGYGRTLGFPTANLDRRQWARLKAKPKLGVWAGTAEIKNGKYKNKKFLAGIVIGPLGPAGLPAIEAHLLDFEGNLYGQRVELGLKKFLRVYKQFVSMPSLKRQIAKDIRLVRYYGN